MSRMKHTAYSPRGQDGLNFRAKGVIPVCSNSIK